MKLEESKTNSPKYIVKEHSNLLNDGNDLFYVYTHYPTTEPDVMVMPFVSKANAELFCEALNAESERREVDLARLKGMDNVVVPRDATFKEYALSNIGYCSCGAVVIERGINGGMYDIYCRKCGKRILWEKVK